MQQGSDPLQWRIPGFYFAYFAALGLFLPFWPLYLNAHGFDPQAIGLLMSLFGLTKLVGPWIVGWLSDHYGQPMRWIRLASMATLLTFSGVFLAHDLLLMGLVMTAFTLAWNAAMPQFEAVTLRHLGERAHRYARIRLWGSVGFIVTALGMGPLLDFTDARLIPFTMLLVLGFMLLLAWCVPNPPEPRDLRAASSPSMFAILRQAKIIMFLLACFLLQASHGTYYAFFSLHLEQHGHSKTLTGLLWALGVLAEVAVFLVIHRWLAYTGAVFLMQLSLFLTALRWLLIGGLPESIPSLILAQLLHAFSFGVAHAAGIEFVRQHFSAGSEGRGQALLSSLGYGAGGVLGFWLAGLFWQNLGAWWAFAISATLALLGAVLLLPLHRNVTLNQAD